MAARGAECPPVALDVEHFSMGHASQASPAFGEVSSKVSIAIRESEVKRISGERDERCRTTSS